MVFLKTQNSNIIIKKTKKGNLMLLAVSSMFRL
jgi:hypothetical protein